MIQKFCCFCGSTQHSLSNCPWKRGIHSECEWKALEKYRIFSFLNNFVKS